MVNYTTTNGPYNTKVTVKDESDKLSAYDIAESSSRDDYDGQETGHTFRKTIEFPSADYYAFRFGLTHEDIKTYSDKHVGRFLKTSGTLYYLPQYENSFYFYFGLQNGNTALDEFNKQFFSECPPKSLVDTTPEVVTYNTDGFDICEGGANVIVSINRITVDSKRNENHKDTEYEQYSLILFAFGSSKLGSEHKQTVDYVKKKIRPNSKVTISGYSDAIGDSLVNNKLALARAKAVAKRLQIPNAEVVGVGESEILYKTNLPECRFYCRTVLITIETPINDKFDE